jgi:hypothetical protein
MVDNYGNQGNLGRDEIGRKGGMTGGTTSMQRDQPVGQKVKQGWNEFKSKIKTKWNRLDDNELDTYSSRNRNDFVGYVHGKVGGDRSMIERDIDTYSRETNYRWD